ncbi:MAG: hypothetical protein RIQ52_1619 [Pseudomonadota bacterium]|jgi:thiol:disulfide interchange protein DsbA
MIKTALGIVLLVQMAFVNAAPAPRAEDVPQEGKQYERLTPPQPTTEPDKIEVMEFFWYGCPHCYHFEPELNAWLKNKPANVRFIRQPAVFNPQWRAHAKAFFTAEALGVLDKVHADFYDSIQNKKRALTEENDLAKFFAEHGVSDQDFRSAYRSFAVDSRLRQADTMAARYGITGTPGLIVNGKYRITGSLAKTFPNMLAITDYLIKQESKGK